MCDIGKPLEIVNAVPLSLPAPLRKEQPSEQSEQPVTVEVPAVAETTAEPVTAERS